MRRTSTGYEAGDGELDLRSGRAVGVSRFATHSCGVHTDTVAAAESLSFIKARMFHLLINVIYIYFGQKKRLIIWKKYKFPIERLKIFQNKMPVLTNRC